MSEQRAAKRLVRTLLLFFLLLALPLGLLIARTYQQLAKEALLQHRTAAEALVSRIDESVHALLSPEELRPFGDYSFFSVADNPLLRQKAVNYSPLSTFPDQSSLPGLVGYFQIDPQGRFSSPMLPDLAGAAGLPSAELARRRELYRRLQSILEENYLLAGRVEQQEPDAGVQQEEQAAGAPSEQNQILDRLNERLAAGLGSAAAGMEADKNPSSAADLLQQEVESEKKDQAAASAPSEYFGKGAKRERRKEWVNIPATQNVARNAQAPILDELKESSEAVRADDDSALKLQQSTRILTFESEIDPLQAGLLGSDYLIFYRKAWRDSRRYLQGFVVQRRDFISAVVNDAFYSSSLGPVAELKLSMFGRAVRRLRPRSSASRVWSQAELPPAQTEGSPQAIFRSSLAAPLDQTVIELVSAVPLSSTGEGLVHTLTFVLIASLLGGFYSLYRLGKRQIELAAQQTNFVSAISHELKTPLTSIRMYGEMLRSNWVADESKRKSYYDFIFFESERLSRLINNVLTLARIGNSSFEEPSLAPMSASSLLDLARSRVDSQVAQAGFELRVDCAASDAQAQVLVDEDLFVQIIVNLVDNALKFSAKAETKAVEIGCRRESQRPQEICFYVRDFGPGVPDGEMKKIFALFYRPGSELTRTTKGTGIGLALVKELASQMRGEVDLRNRRPGAEFLLFLPLA